MFSKKKKHSLPEIKRSQSFSNSHSVKIVGTIVPPTVQTLTRPPATLSRRPVTQPTLFAAAATTTTTTTTPLKSAARFVSPSDICSKLQDELPLQFMVIHGPYGDSSVSTFAEDEKFTARFIQRLQLVTFESEGGKTYEIPISSSVSASAIYDPQEKLEQALSGYLFPTPSHVMLQRVHPQFVAVIRGHADEEDPKYTVEVGDVLFLLGETKSGKKRFLKCVHVASGLTKLIREESKVELSTSPEKIQIPLSTMMQYVSCPMRVLVSLRCTRSDCFIDKKIVGVLAKKIHSNLIICSRVLLPSDRVTKLFAIPEHFDLDLQQIKSSEREYETLCSDSADQLQQFDPEMVNYEILSESHTKHTSFTLDIQRAFYNTAMHDKKENGIICPVKLRKYFPLKRFTASTNQPAVQLGSSNNSAEKRIALLEETVRVMFNTFKLLQERLNRGENTVQESQFETMAKTAFNMAVDLQKSVSDLQNTSALMKTELSVIKKSLENSVGNPKGDDDDYQSLLPREASSSENYEKTVNSPLTMSARNQQYLKSLTTQQVSKMLASLEMNEHIQTFLNEGIDGKKLASLRSLELCKSLRIKDEGQRNKLLQLINGEVSVFPFISL